jgi:preprotein translocase subunit SecB
MKVKFSPLELHSFELLESHFSFNVPNEEEVNVSLLFKSYNVNIDFTHKIHEEVEIHVFVRIEVNYLKKPKPGYSLMSEGVGIFQIEDDSQLSEGTAGNLKFYSTLNMMINNLRNIMFQSSNIGPMGGYLLPPIDIIDLFKKKDKQSSKKS